MEDLRLAELAGEGDMLGIGDGLVGEYHDQVLHPGVDDLLHRRGVERPAHVDAVDLRTEGRMARLDGDGHGNAPFAREKHSTVRQE